MTQTDIRTETSAPAPTTDACACDAPCGSSRVGVSRRTAIGVGVLAGAAMVTACSSSDTPASSSSTSATSSTSSATASTSPSSSSSASSSEAEPTENDDTSSSSATSSASSTAAAPAGAALAKVADVPAGGSLIVGGAGQQIALAKNADGSIVAHSAICTHQGCTVKADGATLACPCHGSMFDAFTGAVTKSPAGSPLAEVKVEVSGDAVYLTA